MHPHSTFSNQTYRLLTFEFISLKDDVDIFVLISALFMPLSIYGLKLACIYVRGFCRLGMAGTR